MASQIPHGKTLDTDFMFTKLVVADLDGAVAFYSSVIGLVEMNRVEAAITGRQVSEVVFMPTYQGGPMFILAQFHDQEKPSSDELILGFATRDIEAALGRAVEAGGAVAEGPIEVPGTGGMKVAFVTDPEGHLVQLSQAGG